MTTRDRPRRARRGEGELLRDEILDAAERLLGEHGSPAAVSMRAVASAVGVTPPSIYLHFADKDELFFAVCQRRFNEFGTELLAAVRGLEDPREQIEALGRAYVRYGLERPEHYRVLFSGLVDVERHVTDLSALPGHQALMVLVDVVRRGMESGVFAPGDPGHVAVGVWAMVHGYLSLIIAEKHNLPDVDLLGAQSTVLLMALRSLQP
jgi:AcrR family transcriptional regulator